MLATGWWRLAGRICRPWACVRTGNPRSGARDPAQGFRNSGIGSQGVRYSLGLMVKTKSTVINLDADSYAMG